MNKIILAALLAVFAHAEESEFFAESSEVVFVPPLEIKGIEPVKTKPRTIKVASRAQLLAQQRIKLIQ